MSENKNEEINEVKKEPETEAVKEEVKQAEAPTESTQVPPQANQGPVNNQVPPQMNQGYPNNGQVPPFNGNVPPQYAQYPYPSKKKFPWKSVLKYACIFIVAGACGFGGGFLAGKLNENEKSSEMSDMTQFGNGNMPGNFSGATPDSGSDSDSNGTTQSSSVALGLYVTTSDDGLYIAGFSDGSKAETAGLAAGDKIETVDGKTYETVSDISTYVQTLKAGDTVTVVVLRDGSEVTAKVELITSTSSSQSSNNIQLPSSTESSDSYQS